jgi:1-deoxy-D-xylulose-5-phosphate synthase
LQRAYDQIIEDVALQNLPVVFCIDRAGIVGEDGVTHQGIFDISFLNTVPGLVSMAPKDGEELKEMLEFALHLNKPVAIRYPRGKIDSLSGNNALSKIELGKPEILREGEDFAVIALGSMVMPSLEAIELLKKEGYSGAVINARFVKPLDTKSFRALGNKFKFIFTAEEGIIDSGFGSALENLISKPVIKIGLPCEFIAHGKRELLLEKYGLSARAIADKIHLVICPR